MKLWSLQPKLGLLILLALLPVVALLIREAAVERARAVEEAKTDAVRLASQVAGTEETLIETLRQLLMTLAQVDSIRDSSVPGCETLLKSLVQTNTIYWNIGVCDASGRVICSGGPLGFPADQRNEPWFQRTMETNAFSWGDFRVNGAGKPTVSVGYPVVNALNRPIGAVFVELDLQAISVYNLRQSFRHEGYMVSVDKEGQIFLRYPDPEAWIGKFLKGVNLAEVLGDREKGTFTLTDDKGVERLYAIQRLDIPGGESFYIGVSVLKEQAVSSPGLVLIKRLAIIGGIGAVTLIAVWIFGNRYVVRPTRHLVGVARAISQGKLGVRSSLPDSAGEFKEIGTAINQMADTLGNRIIELDTVRHELQEAHNELEARVERRTEELRRSNEELERFAYVASHDLQEPLRMVASYTQLLARRYGDQLDQNARDFIGYAVDGAQRMQAFIRDLLQYSRLGTQGRPFEPVEMNALLREVEGNLRYSIEEAGAEIEVGELPTISGDRVQLSQLFQNLIGNALKFRSDKPLKISVNAAHEDGAWRFSVRDNGIGFAQEDADRVFVMFQRLNTRKEYEGTGMGLPICKKIVERHGGRIWVESRKGEGTTFYFTIRETTA